MTLSPKLEGGVGFEQAVQQPDALAPIADLAGLFVNTRSAQGPSAGDKTRAFKQDLNKKLVDGLSVAQQMRDEGLEQQALRHERKTKLEFAKAGGDLNSGETQELMSTLTGRPPENIGFSQEEVAYRNMIESPEFQQKFLSTYSTHPDASDEEREQLAVSRLQRAAALENIIEETRIDWNANEGQASRIQIIQDWQKANEGALYLMGRNGGNVSQDQVQAATVQFGQLEAAILASRPAGIKPEEWKPVADALAQTKEQLQLVERLTSTEEMSADALQSVIQGIREVEGFSANEKNLAIALLQRDTRAFVELGAFTGSRFKELLESSLTVDLTSTDDALEAGAGTGVVEPAEGSTAFTEKELAPHSTSSPRKKFADAENLATLAGTMKDVVNDPEKFSEWISLTNAGLSGLYSMAAKSQAWATAEGYNKYFTPSFFKVMDEVRYGGSQLAYRSLYNKTNEAINANITALRANIVSQTQNDIVTYDKASNSLVFNKENFMASDRISNYEKEQFLRLVDSKYGGDFQKAITDRGSNLPAMRQIAEELADTNVTQRIRAIKQLETIRGRLAKPEETVQGGDDDDTLEGSQGGDGINTAEVYNIPREVSEDTEFTQAVSSLASDLGANPNDLFRIMQFETGGSFNPAQKNVAGSGATGLIQFMPTTAKELGVTTEQLAKMSRTEQMAYVEKYFKGKLKGVSNPNLGDLYMAVLWPKAVGKSDNYVLFDEGDGQTYSQNAGLDLNDDGQITKGEATQQVIDRTGGGLTQVAGMSFPEPTEAPLSSPRPASFLETKGGSTQVASNTARGSQSGSEGTQEVAEADQATEGAKQGEGSSGGVSPERAEQVFSELSAQTKGLLIRLFGDEEAAKQALIDGELEESEIT